MHIYSTGQWVLLFFFYCFCGWVWESCYVSLCQRRWVNRGFLHGPLLPIYGFGAILILFVTLPVENDLRLVWLLGMLAATALEYVVGAAMERLFQVRYWDYSKHRFNLHGYICLSSSIAWGFFSILLVRFVHPPVGRLLADVPSWVVDPLALALTRRLPWMWSALYRRPWTCGKCWSSSPRKTKTCAALQGALRSSPPLPRMIWRRFRERTEVDTLQERIQAGLREAQAARRSRRQERIEAAFRRRTSAKLEALSAIAETLEHCRARLPESDELDELLEKVRTRAGGLAGAHRQVPAPVPADSARKPQQPDERRPPGGFGRPAEDGREIRPRSPICGRVSNR